MVKFSQRFMNEFENQNFTEEQKEWLNNSYNKRLIASQGYIIRTDEKYKCIRVENNHGVFYKIAIKKKGMDGKFINAYKQVKFVTCEPPKAPESLIVIDSMFEDFYFKANDKYNPIFMIAIKDYHLYENSGAQLYENIVDYKEQINDLNDDFVITGEPVNFIEEDFPF